MKIFVFTMAMVALSGSVPENWTRNTSLPKIQVIAASPTANTRSFESENGYLGTTFRYKAVPTIASEPFESDAKAVSFALKFLKAHFGPTQFKFKTDRIQRSSSGRKTPLSDSDRGHTIVFDAYWHGIKIDGFYAIIYINGTTVKDATVQLGQARILPGSLNKLISKESAPLNGATYLNNLHRFICVI